MGYQENEAGDYFESNQETDDIEEQEEVAEESEQEDSDEGEGSEGDSEESEESDDDADQEAKEAKDKEEQTKQELADLLDEESMSKKVRIKVNGEEKVMSVKEAIKVKQLEEASHQRMREAAEAKKMASDLLSIAKNNPKKFFEITGEDPFEFAQSTMLERLEMMGMSEEQRHAYQLEQENKTLKEREQARENNARRQKFEQETAQAYEALEKEVDEAWKDSKLPTTNDFRSSIAQVMLADRAQKQQEAAAMGINPASLKVEEFLTAKDAAAIVKKNWHESVRQTIAQLDAEATLELLGDETLKVIQKAIVKRASDKTSPKFAKTGPGKKKPASSKTAKRQPLTDKEYREWQAKIEAQMS